MIEALVSYVVAKLGDSAVGKAGRALLINDDIEWLKGELSMMHALVRDMDRRSETDEAVKEWLEQLRNVAFKIENFVDLNAYHRENVSRDSVANLDLFSQMKAAQEIASIKEEVGSIARRAQNYCFHRPRGERESSSRSSNICNRITQQRVGYSFRLEEVELVGFDEDVRQLREWLLSDDDNTPWSFMCLVGMGGSGKTALAKTVYKLVHNHFDHHLWLTVSGYPQLNDFLGAMKEALLQIHASNGLGKRYVLVIDDICDLCFCSAMIDALPANGRGRIIFTSRQNITASLVNENCLVHILKPLPNELAWKLFCKKAFPSHSSPEICPDYLKDEATEIVRRCSGLPLAIVLTGGLMSTKGTSPREWKDVLVHFDQELLNNPRLESINHIFQASCNSLPTHLQYCFLYSCLFPKGSQIKRKKIIRLWVAQGFVKEQRGKTLEEVANDYFIQLIEKSMLEPVVSNFTGELISYRVHDIMHGLAVSNFKNGFGIFDELFFNRMIKKRYLAIHHNANVTVSKNQYIEAHALLVFECCNLAPVLPRCKFLRVLCLDGICMHYLSDQVGDLCHLTYLGLRGTRIKCLPSSLQKLHNLETLDVRDTLIKFLPSSITNIKKLRHLLLRNMKIHGSDVLVMMPSGIGNLRHLQTLSGLKADIYSLELAHLTQLKKLYVSITGQEEARTLFAAINQIADLHSLKIVCRDRHGKYTELMLETLLPLPQYLEKLTLGANIMELPLWFAHFKSLRVLVLVNSMLVFDPLSNLSGLPNLVSLSLFHAYTGEQMCCRQGGFPKLRHLHITSFIELEEWTPIEEGTMPCIQYIRIVDCGKLRMLPQGFEQLKTLESLELIEMSQEFIRKLVEEDFYKVHPISKVIALPRISCERNLLDPENLQIKIHESSGASSSSSPFVAASSSSPFVEATRKRKLGDQTD